jgi:hypothetical protein
VRPPSLRTTIAIVVTIIWAVAYMVSIFNPKFVPNPAITSVMVLVIGYLFVSDRARRNGKNGKNGNGTSSNGSSN